MLQRSGFSLLLFTLLISLSAMAQWGKLKGQERYNASAMIYRGSDFGDKFMMLGNDKGDFGQPMITLFDPYSKPVDYYGDSGTARPDIDGASARLLQGEQISNDYTLIMGIRKTSDSAHPFLLMLDRKGKLVKEFGNNGKVYLPFACGPYQKIVMHTNENRIVLSGVFDKTIEGQKYIPFVFFACYDMNGKPVASFGNNGYAEWHDMKTFSILDMGDFLLNSDGSLSLACATRLPSNDGAMVLLQLDNNGKIKPVAGKDYQIYWKEQEVFKVARVLNWTNNRFVVFRHRYEPSGNYTLFDICAFQQDGNIDFSFADNGLKRMSSKYGNKAISQDLLVKSDGRFRILFAAKNNQSNDVFVQSLGLTDNGNRDYNYTPGGVCKLNLSFSGEKSGVRFIDKMNLVYWETAPNGTGGTYVMTDIGERVEAASNDYAMFEAKYEGSQPLPAALVAAKTPAPVVADPPRDASKDNMVIEETFSKLEKCLNDWGNDMKKRMDIVTQIGNCNGDASCLSTLFKRLKNHLAGMQANININYFNDIKSIKPSWASCAELNSLYYSFTPALGSAESHYEMAAGTAGNTIQYLNNSTEYGKMVKILFMEYDKADVSFQDAFEEIAKAYDVYKKKTCSNLKPSSALASGNPIRESLSNWQESLSIKINEMAKKQKEEDAAKKAAIENKKSEPGVCDNCKGSGYEYEYKKCWFCGGDGVTTEIVTGEKTIGTKKVYKGTNTLGTQDKYELRDIKSVDIKGKREVTCSLCKGEGQVKTGKKKTCHVCNGSGKS